MMNGGTFNRIECNRITLGSLKDRHCQYHPASVRKLRDKKTKVPFEETNKLKQKERSV